MQRLGLARRELDHDLREPGGLVADRAVVQELGARATRRRQDLLLVVRRVDAARAALLRLLRDAAQAPRVGIVARERRGRLRAAAAGWRTARAARLR